MKLFRFRYSPYARKVQVLLDLLGKKYECVEVPYGDRNELAMLTGGYVYVPVLVDDDGTVVTESRDICERLVSQRGGERLVPDALEGPIWAYSDFCDTVVEDVLFRVSSPSVRDAWPSPSDRALYVLVKERKFGAGCVDAWARDRETLLARGRRLLAPTLRTLERAPFVFGQTPTLADAALYGNSIMLEESEPGLLEKLSPVLVRHARRLEASIPLVG